MAKIAIVDDSRLARTFWVGCLKKLECELVEIEPTSLGDVLKSLRENRPDILLTDYLMPNCSGTTLVGAIHEDPRLTSIKILMISAHHDEDIREYMEGHGVNAFLSKPVDPKDLVEQVLDLMDQVESGN